MLNSLAYQYVVMAVMLAHVNMLAKRCHLDEPNPIRIENTVDRYASPYITPMGFIGRITTSKYKYGFTHSGSIVVVTKLEDGKYQSMGLYRGNRSMKEFMDEFSKIKSTINTNDAFRLATNWLAGIDIDVSRLQKEQPVKIEQQVCHAEMGVGVPCPLYYVKWGKEGVDENGHPITPIISIMISGINGELLSLIIANDDYAKHTFKFIKDVNDLLAIPDGDFLKYTSEQRSNLVVRFSALNDISTDALVQTNVPPVTK